MRKLLLTMISGALLAPACVLAADPGEADPRREVGAVLAWRLGPEAVEERCRSEDPAGIPVREKALKAWLAKNADLIRQVDERVAEVVPLVDSASNRDGIVDMVRAQVKRMLLESIFAGRNTMELQTICHAETNPASPRWNNPGMPNVALSLAALYDWKVARGKN